MYGYPGTFVSNCDAKPAKHSQVPPATTALQAMQEPHLAWRRLEWVRSNVYHVNLYADNRQVLLALHLLPASRLLQVSRTLKVHRR